MGFLQIKYIWLLSPAQVHREPDVRQRAAGAHEEAAKVWLGLALLLSAPGLWQWQRPECSGQEDESCHCKHVHSSNS